MRIQDLESIQLDGIKEAANIGGGHAATALTQMLGKEVGVQVPEIDIRPLENSAELLGDNFGIAVVSLTRFFGDVTGRTLFILKDSDASVLVNILLDREVTKPVEYGNLEISSIEEVANIISSSYLSALSEFLGIMLLPSVPSVIRDDLSAVISSVYLEFTEDEDFVFCVETHFHFKEPREDIEAYLLLVPDVEGLTTILKAMKLL